MKISVCEQKVIDILKKEKIQFVREKTFPDLRGGSYRFDFYLPRFNICIEVNGRQHYEFTPHFYKQKNEFLTAQLRDRRKISYCLAHSIKLFCIPFWDFDKIESFSDLTEFRYLALSKYHNDTMWHLYQNNKKSV